MKNAMLDSVRQPESRPATALGRLLVSLRIAASPTGHAEDLPDGDRPRYWSNRPGQHRAETFAIATLVAFTLATLTAGLLIRMIEPSSPGGWLAVCLVTVPGFFAALHLLLLAAAALEKLVHLAGIHPRQPLGHFCGRIFLLLLTAACVIFAQNAGLPPLLRSAVLPWFAVVVANAIAWCLLCARSLLRSLAEAGADPLS